MGKNRRPGYRLYADAVIAFLQAHRGDIAAGPESLPVPLHEGAVDKADMVDAWTVTGLGWTQETQSLMGAFPHRLSSNTPGAELRYVFEGTTVGLTWLVAPDSGKIAYRIDDGPSRTASSWDEHALTFTRPNYVILAENLPPGSHVLHVQVLADKDPASTGTWIRLGAILVH